MADPLPPPATTEPTPATPIPATIATPVADPQQTAVQRLVDFYGINERSPQVQQAAVLWANQIAAWDIANPYGGLGERGRNYAQAVFSGILGLTSGSGTTTVAANQAGIAANAAPPAPTPALSKAYGNNPSSFQDMSDAYAQNLPGYTPVSDLGDSKTQLIAAQIMVGTEEMSRVMGIMRSAGMDVPNVSPYDSRQATAAALQGQLTAAQGTPGLRDDRYFAGELSKSAENVVERASGYHFLGEVAGIPVPANPYEFQGDLAVEYLKGTPTKSSEFFSPVSGLMSTQLPGGEGLQQYAWNMVKGDTTAVDFTNATNFLFVKAAGEYGPYGALFGGPSYAGTPSSEGIRKQEVFTFTPQLAATLSSRMAGMGYTPARQYDTGSLADLAWGMVQNKTTLTNEGFKTVKELSPSGLYIAGLMAPAPSSDRLVGGGKVAAVGTTVAVSVKGDRVGITPTSPVGVEIAMAEGGLPRPFVSAGKGAAIALTPNEQIESNLISGAKTAFIGMIPFVGADLVAYRGIQSEKAREAEVNAQIVAQGPYEQRKDITAAALSTAGVAVDVWTGLVPTYHGGLNVGWGEWTPFKSQLTAYGQTGDTGTNAYLAQREQINKESPAIQALTDTIKSDQITRDSILKGNLDAEGKFTGTTEQFAALKELNAKDNLYADQINQFSTRSQQVENQAISSGILLGDGKGGFILNPDRERAYGAFSDVSNAFQKTITGKTPGEWYSYEQTEGFQTAKNYVDPSLVNNIALSTYFVPIVGIPIGFASTHITAPVLNTTIFSPQFGEGAWTMVSNPEKVVKTAAMGLALYVATAGVGEMAMSSLPAAEVGTYSAITPSTRAASMWQAPLTQAAIGAGFIGKSVYEIQTSDLSPASKSSAYGGFYGQLNVMGAAAMYPEALAGVGNYGAVRFDVKPAYTELTLRQETTLEPTILTRSGLLSQDTIVAQTQRFATPSIGNSVVDPILNRIFNVRSEGNPTLLLNTDIGRMVDIGNFINAKGGGFETIQGFGTTTRTLTARMTETPGVWEATGELRITGQYTEANPLELIKQGKVDEALTGKDWIDTTNELIGTSQKRNVDVTRGLEAYVMEGTTLQELLNIYPPVRGGSPFEYNVVTAAEHTSSLNTVIDYGQGRISTTQLIRTASEFEQLNTGKILTNTPVPASRIIDFVDTHPEWNRLNAPEYAGVFNARGLPMTWERGEGGVSWVSRDVLGTARETYNMGGEYHLHTHPEYTLSEWLSGRMDTHGGAQWLQQYYQDLPLLNKLSVRYELDVVPRIDYVSAKAGIIDRARPIATPSEQDLIVYSSGNVQPGSDLISSFIAAPRGVIEIREPFGGWQNYQEYVDRINGGATPHIQRQNLGIAEPTQYYKNTPLDRSYVGSDVIGITETMHMESSPFNRMTHDALLRIARGNPQEEFYILHPSEPSLLNSGSNLGRTNFQIQSPELLQVSKASGQQLSEVERGYSPQVPRATTERGVAFIPETNVISAPPIKAGNMNMMVASVQIQSPKQVTPQQLIQPQVITPQFVQPQIQSVDTEKGYAFIPDVMQVSKQAKESQRDVSQIFRVSSASDLASISSIDRLSIYDQQQTPMQKTGQIQQQTPGFVQIQTPQQIPVVTPKPPTPIIPLIPLLPPFFGGGGGVGGYKNPYRNRKTEIFTYAPRNLKGLIGLPKGRTPAMNKLRRK